MWIFLSDSSLCILTQTPAEVEARLLDAAAFEEEDLSVALTTLRDNLKHAIAIATDHKAIKVRP